MQSFLQRFGALVLGVLHGLDRIRFRGSIRWLSKPAGMMHFLSKTSIKLKEFPAFAKDTTATLRRQLEEPAQEQGRPVEHLPSSASSKEDRAREIAQRDGIQEGLVAVLTCVEPCLTYQVRGKRSLGKLVLQAEHGKCQHYYHYYRDRKLGWLYTRQQTWFPFTTFIGLNGREWLAQQLDAAGLGYVRRDNCFAWLQDLKRAQALLDKQLRTDWAVLLERLAQRSHRQRAQLLPLPTPYYWSVQESEWASDIMFRRQQDLEALMPSLIRHGLISLGSADVLRFLGHAVPAHGGVHGQFVGEVLSDWKRRPEGVRLKHQVKKNWIKMYDKQGTLLRIETVINDVEGMKSYRAKENDPTGPKDWRRLRKGVADLHRRAEISQKANERYAASLATVEEATPLKDLSDPVCQPVTWHGRRLRGLQPLAVADAALLEAVSRGEFLINGFRNRDVRVILFGECTDRAQARREAAKVTRQLRLLRAHSLIQKVAKTHRYMLSPQGTKIIAALLNARNTSVEKLLKAA
jgi:hypothetical protein